MRGLAVGLVLGFALAVLLGVGPALPVPTLPDLVARLDGGASPTATPISAAALRPPATPTARSTAKPRAPSSATAAHSAPTPVASPLATEAPSRAAPVRDTPVAAPAAPSSPASVPASSPPPAPVTPAPGDRVTLTATVRDVAASARIIAVDGVVGGYDTLALTPESRLRFADGRAATLQDVRPGMWVRASGTPVGNGAVLATEVILDPDR